MNTYEVDVRGYVNHTVRIDALSKVDAKRKLSEKLEQEEKSAVIQWDTDLYEDDFELVDLDRERKDNALFHASNLMIEKIGFQEFLKVQKDFRNGFESLINGFLKEVA